MVKKKRKDIMNLELQRPLNVGNATSHAVTIVLRAHRYIVIYELAFALA